MKTGDKARRKWTVGLVEDRALHRCVLTRRLGRMPDIAAVALFERLVDIAPETSPEILVIADHLFGRRETGLLRGWDGARRPRVFVWSLMGPLTPQDLSAVPIDGVLHPADTDEHLRAKLTGVVAVGPAAPAFTGRELAVIRATVAGESLKTMACRLGCSVQTVHTYRQRAMRKMGVRSLPEFTRWWDHHGHLQVALEEG